MEAELHILWLGTDIQKKSKAELMQVALFPVSGTV